MNINFDNYKLNNIQISKNIYASKDKTSNNSFNNKSVVYEKNASNLLPNNDKISTKPLKPQQTTDENQVQHLKDLVNKVFNNQSQIWNGSFDKNLIYKLKTSKIDQKTQDKAKELISENGYYGVKKTTERIIDFAKNILSKDPSKIDKVKKAIEKGFKEAEKIWGDKMPEISKQTYKSIMEEFNSLQNKKVFSI